MGSSPPLVPGRRFSVNVANPGVSDLSRTPRFGHERRARRAGHAANMFRGVALAGLAAGDPMSFDVVPVNETSLGFHVGLRDAALTTHVASPPDSQPIHF